MQVGKGFTPVCVCVCVCIRVITTWPIDLIFSMQVGHYHIYVEFGCESHGVKAKITAAKSFIFFSGW